MSRIHDAQLSALIRQTQEVQRSSSPTLAPMAPSINQAGSFQVLEHSLSSAVLPDTPPGYALYFLREGSAPGARITIRGAGTWENMAPGECFSGRFDSLKLERGSRSVTSGTVRLLVVMSPGVVAGMVPETSSAGNLGGGLVGPNGATSQTRNHATANVPAAVTDGVDVTGCRGFRVLLASNDAASTLSGGGSVRIWRQSSRSAVNSGTWFKTSLVYNDLSDFTSVQYAQLPDEELKVSEGRVYAEAVSVTNSAGVLLVAVETWG